MAKDNNNIPDDVNKLIEEQIKETQEAVDSDATSNEIANSDELLDTPPEAMAEAEMLEGNSDETGLNAALYTGEGFNRGSVVNVSIADAMKKDYLDYAMSVIVARALPDIKDGLKPSQRRILVTMKDLLLWPTSSYRKSAKITGQTTGDYHPHGDAAAYQTLVKMAQDFSMRYPLVHGQGNFGSIDGDMPAASRYTEAKLSKIAVELLRDLDKGTVLFRPSYDGHLNEPIALPSAYPNLLVNGSEGIAVGMATKIPPHNLGEIIDGLIKMIDVGNSWKGITLYNQLWKLKESHNRIPVLLTSEPFEYWVNYFNPTAPDFRGRVAVTKDLIRDGSLDTDKAAVLSGDYTTLEKFIATKNKEYGVETSPLSLYPKFSSLVTTQDLMEFIKGPDFPTRGQIFNQKEILNYYETGRGKVTTRGVITVEEDKKGNQSVIVTELPYQVNKAVLIQNIAELVQADKIMGIKALRDESAKNEIRIVMELKSGTTPQVVISKLYKYTALQMNFSANMIALVDDEPKTLNLKRMLELYLEHRMTVTIRRLEFELAQNKYQAHILEGLLKALDFIDEVIKVIRASKNQEEARTNLITRFDLTEVQAQAILDMQLRKLAALERQKIQDEYDGINELIKHHESYLESEAKILELIRVELLEVREKFADKRRTKVFKGGIDEPEEIDLIAKEETFVTISNTGYIKRISPEEYRLQRRGGKGSMGAKLKENDYVKHALLCTTHDWIFIFTGDGRVFKLRCYDIPEAKKVTKGLPIVNLIQVTQDTKISAVLALGPEAKDKKSMVLVTEKGIIKKSPLKEFDNIRKNGLAAITLKDGDKLVGVNLTTGDNQLIVVTKKGKSIRFDEKKVKSSGRSSMGVKGITVKADDKVISMDVVVNETDMLFTVSANGYGKCSTMDLFKVQGRGGQGIFASKVNAKTGNLVYAHIFTAEEKQQDTEIIVITKQGQVVKTEFKTVPTLGRQTSGVRVIRVADGDEVIGVAG